MATAWVKGANAVNSGGIVGTLAITPGAVGQLLMVYGAVYRTTTQATAISISDTAANTWNQVNGLLTDGVSGSTSAGRARIWWAIANGNTSTTVTVTGSGGSGSASDAWLIMIDDFSGTDTATPVNANSNGSGNSASPASGNATPTVNDCILWSPVLDSTSAAPSGWTKRQDTGAGYITSTKQLSGGGGSAQSITYSGTSAPWLCSIVAIAPTIINVGEYQPITLFQPAEPRGLLGYA